MDLSEQFLSPIIATIPFWMRWDNFLELKGEGGAKYKNVQVRVPRSCFALFYGFILYSVSEAFTKEPVSVIYFPHLSFLENPFFLSLFVSSPLSLILRYKLYHMRHPPSKQEHRAEMMTTFYKYLVNTYYMLVNMQATMWEVWLNRMLSIFW